jgi:hypothetical protein
MRPFYFSSFASSPDLLGVLVVLVLLGVLGLIGVARRRLSYAVC